MVNFHPYYLFLFIGFGLFASCSSKEDESVSGPNIVYIFADDLGYGDLGCFGATDISTPNIDGLAKEGIQFTSFYSASSVCSPSRAALLTGRIPQRTGINSVFFPESFTGLPEEEITIAELLKPKGYTSGIVGKWHLGHHYKYLPLQQGFDSYFGIPYSNDMESVVYMRDNDMVQSKVDQSKTPARYTEEALEFIEQNKNKPFFLYLAHNMPHVPLHVGEQHKNTSKRGLYGDVIQEIDWSVGQVVQKLEALNLLENTLVIFSSDNGPWLVMEDHGGSAGPLREGKNYTFEGGMRVPTVAMWKGKIPKGTVYENMATQMDWLPTIAALAEADLPMNKELDGEDISPVLFNTGKRVDSTFLYFDLAKLEGYRKGKWKVKKPYKGFGGNPWKSAVPAHDSLLIDLSVDLGETTNLFAEYPELARTLFQEMEAEYKALGELPPSLFIRSIEDNSHFDHLDSRKK